jgi:hypothetical protein
VRGSTAGTAATRGRHAAGRNETAIVRKAPHRLAGAYGALQRDGGTDHRDAQSTPMYSARSTCRGAGATA